MTFDMVMQNLLDPVILCFIIGFVAKLCKISLRMPDSTYETLSIYLFLAIGLKGGYELNNHALEDIMGPVLAGVLLSLLMTGLCYWVVRRCGGFNALDAGAVAAHYGSVSAITYAVVTNNLEDYKITFEGYLTVFLVTMEITGLAFGIFLARVCSRHSIAHLGETLREVVLNKCIYLLLAGFLVGWVSSTRSFSHVEILFLDLFKGVLCFFLLEMGLLSAERCKDMKKLGSFLAIFAVVMPVVGAILGVGLSYCIGLSFGGAVVIGTIVASASYVAAPMACRAAIPEANISACITAALGITFPFNITFGIPLYEWFAQIVYSAPK